MGEQKFTRMLFGLTSTQLVKLIQTPGLKQADTQVISEPNK